jgi:hypothetical protein
MCDVSKGGGGGGLGGLQRNEHMTFLVDKIDMWGFPNGTNNECGFTKDRNVFILLCIWFVAKYPISILIIRRNTILKLKIVSQNKTIKNL